MLTHVRFENMISRDSQLTSILKYYLWYYGRGLVLELGISTSWNSNLDSSHKHVD